MHALSAGKELISSPAYLVWNYSLTTSVDFLDQKMSSSMFSEIPKLASSSDYPRWKQTVTAYLGVQKALKVIKRSPPVFDPKKDNTAEVETWEELEGITRGVIILSLHPTIAEAIDASKPVKDVWEEIQDKYRKPGPSGIYSEFKKILATEIPSNSDPSLALESLKTGFSKMKSLECEVPHKITVLMYMSKLGGPGYELIVQNLALAEDLSKPSITEIERLVRLAWEQRSSKRPPPRLLKSQWSSQTLENHRSWVSKGRPPSQNGKGEERRSRWRRNLRPKKKRRKGPPKKDTLN
jgi:hypothetical protein